MSILQPWMDDRGLVQTESGEFEVISTEERLRQLIRKYDDIKWGNVEYGYSKYDLREMRSIADQIIEIVRVEVDS